MDCQLVSPHRHEALFCSRLLMEVLGFHLFNFSLAFTWYSLLLSCCQQNLVEIRVTTTKAFLKHRLTPTILKHFKTDYTDKAKFDVELDVLASLIKWAFRRTIVSVWRVEALFVSSALRSSKTSWASRCRPRDCPFPGSSRDRERPTAHGSFHFPCCRIADKHRRHGNLRGQQRYSNFLPATSVCHDARWAQVGQRGHSRGTLGIPRWATRPVLLCSAA